MADPGQNNRSKIFLSATRRKPFTLAHELAHILTNAGHLGEKYNLDYNDTPERVEHNLMKKRTSDAHTKITDTRRLYNIQEAAITKETQPK